MHFGVDWFRSTTTGEQLSKSSVGGGFSSMSIQSSQRVLSSLMEETRGLSDSTKAYPGLCQAYSEIPQGAHSNYLADCMISVLASSVRQGIQSSHRFPYGYLVTTSPVSPREAYPTRTEYIRVAGSNFDPLT
ncbi:hypothetical protein AMTR_s00087p00152790 [Amborella trichopoda]|uniref:Uncharacterized protein n=1 Tax=Amborella trichopoda TaxID=13333 RepID=W1P4M3_AMBTC|nr:hypothetical protein AMTR_s00087p00152790 [Amborella trichopoda]